MTREPELPRRRRGWRRPGEAGRACSYSPGVYAFQMSSPAKVPRAPDYWIGLSTWSVRRAWFAAETSLVSSAITCTSTM
jgi:hypothetical protein